MICTLPPDQCGIGGQEGGRWTGDGFEPSGLTIKGRPLYR
jgi:hypothetical protein